MDRKKILIALVSLILALGVGVAQFFYVSNQYVDQEIAVLIAKNDISSGVLLSDDMFEIKNISQKDYVKEMVSSIGSVKAYSKIDIPKGSYLLSNMADAKTIPEPKDGQQRVTIRVDLYSSLAGKIKPGDVIDIGYIPSDETREAGIIAEKLTIFDLTDEKGANVRKTSDNAYDEQVMIPSALTLLVNSKEQAILLKDREKSGSLFVVGY